MMVLGLLYVPQICDVVRTVELVAGTFLPSIEGEFVSAEKIFARKYRMTFVTAILRFKQIVKVSKVQFSVT